MKMLTEQWGETKTTLLEGLTGSKREITGKMLENQKQNIINETAASGAVQASDIANFRKAVLPMIRRIIPGTIATELVGVQPMSGPVGLVYTMRYKYQEAVTHNDAMSAFGGFDIAAGDEAFGNAKPIRQFYSGNTGAAQAAGASGIGTAGGPANIDQSQAIGNAWGATKDSTNYTLGTVNYGPYTVNVGGTLLGGSGSFIEGSGGRKMALEVISQAVEAGSRKLQAGWTIEAMQDLNSQHGGMDLESELTKTLSAEIVQEIDAEIINDLLGLAGTARNFDFSVTGIGPSYAPAFVGDRFANLGVRINEVANVIARKTRRGTGNYIVVSPMIVSVLQSAAKAVFAPAVEGSFKGPNNTMLVGTLNGMIKVYSYIWNQAGPGAGGSGAIGTTAGSDIILVGYKGGNAETDAGYFYCPYIPLMSSGAVMNPVTFQPVVSLMTRYGKLAFTSTTTSLGNSADYYGKVVVTNLDFI